jgi:hypothetical protein
MAKYPVFDPQPYTGNLPTQIEAGPPDFLYTGGTAPFYQAPIDARYGRTLAGNEVQDEKAAMANENAWSPGELNALAEMDDVQGNGIFDAPGSHPNIWPDAGVFATRFSLPGYSAREKMFEKSEIKDATTGRAIVPVPSGAVSIDPAAQIAMLEAGRYPTPQPILNANAEYALRAKSIANVAQNPQAVHGFGADETPPSTGAGLTPAQLILATAAVGLAAGGIWALVRKKKMVSNRRRRRR